MFSYTTKILPKEVPEVEAPTPKPSAAQEMDDLRKLAGLKPKPTPAPEKPKKEAK